jgi:hypothetical protein
VHSVSITIYRAGYQKGFVPSTSQLRVVCVVCVVCRVVSPVSSYMVRHSIPVYGPQSLQVSVGFGPEKEDTHYTSPVYPVDNSAGTFLSGRRGAMLISHGSRSVACQSSRRSSWRRSSWPAVSCESY